MTNEFFIQNFMRTFHRQNTQPTNQTAASSAEVKTRQQDTIERTHFYTVQRCNPPHSYMMVVGGGGQQRGRVSKFVCAKNILKRTFRVSEGIFDTAHTHGRARARLNVKLNKPAKMSEKTNRYYKGAARVLMNIVCAFRITITHIHQLTTTAATTGGWGNLLRG